MHIVTVQESLLDVISDVEAGRISSEKIWVTRRDSENEEHQDFYEINLSLVNDELIFSATGDDQDKVKLHRRKTFEFIVEIEDDFGSHNYSVVFPKSKLDLGLRRSKISASAVSPDGTNLLVGTDSGQIFQYDIKTKSFIDKISSAHAADVLKIIVLPSSRVIMTVGLDFQIKLWSLGSDLAAQPVRIFAQQRAQITDAVVIGRGRNFLTSSLDGSVLLWECSSGSAVSEFRRIDDLSDPVTCIALTSGKPVKQEDVIGGKLLFDCQDKYMYVGYKSGVIQQYSVAGHYQTKIKLQRSVVVTSLYAEGDFIVAGYADGLLRVYQVGPAGPTVTCGDNCEPSHWDLPLNPNHPVDQIVATKSTNDEMFFLVSNGPELLLQVKFGGSSFSYSQLGGLSESSKSVSMAKNKDFILVTTNSEILHY